MIVCTHCGTPIKFEDFRLLCDQCLNDSNSIDSAEDAFPYFKIDQNGKERIGPYSAGEFMKIMIQAQSYVTSLRTRLLRLLYGEGKNSLSR